MLRRALSVVVVGVGALAIAVSSDAAPSPPMTLVSVNLAGTASGNGASFPRTITPNGRFVSFSGVASDLVANDTNGHRDAFVRDLKRGRTTLVSVNHAGTASGNLGSEGPYLTPNGRFVLFFSEASDLVPDDTNGHGDAFLRDLKKETTTLVSVTHAGSASANASSYGAAITPNGRFVLFNSDASDLVANDANGAGDVFVRDLHTGTTTLVSVNHAGTASGRGSSLAESITPNGRFVFFTSHAPDLVANDTNTYSDVFVRDLRKRTTTLVSVDRTGTASGDFFSHGILAGDPSFVLLRSSMSITPNGRFVLFTSSASDLVTNDTNGTGDAFVRDLATGTTTLVSVNQGGNASGDDLSTAAAITPNGRFVSFFSSAGDLVPDDTNGTQGPGVDAFVRDLRAGTTKLVSVNRAGTASGNSYSSSGGSITPNGRFVSFDSFASDLVPDDTNGTGDTFVRDLEKGRTTLVSADHTGTASANSASSSTSITPSGRFVLFASPASDLVANDPNGTWDVFVRTLQRGAAAALPANRGQADGG
jgi:hypothetical protein